MVAAAVVIVILVRKIEISHDNRRVDQSSNKN